MKYASKFEISKLIKQFAEVKARQARFIKNQILYQFYFSSISTMFMEIFRFYKCSKLLY